MPQVLLARVNCPSCGQQFQTPVEQIMDVRADPSAKMRVLNGLVNVAACPQCGMRGALGLSFLYHDPDKELALVYMPMEAGRDNLERQQAIGRLTSVVMERMLTMNLELAQATGQAADVPRLLAVRDKLIELSREGRAAQARTEMLEALRTEPTREKLLELLVQAPDEPTRELLIVFGRPLLDYGFFQSLTSRIESAADDDERKQLTALRTEVLDIRDRIDRETRALYEERSALLRDLLLSDDLEALVRRRASELDQAFFNVLAANMEEARAARNEEALSSLQAIWGLLLQMREETLPPEVQLLNRLMAAEDDADIENLLQGNRDLVDERLIQLVEGMEARTREEDQVETADRLALVLEKAKNIAALAMAA